MNIESISIDLNDLDSVRSCAKALVAKNLIPDILILNAGVMRRTREETKQGYEACFGTNYLAHFEFTRLLLPAMAGKARSQKTKSRIVVVASNTHIIANMHWDDLQLTKPGAFTLFGAYGRSKLSSSSLSIPSEDGVSNKSFLFLHSDTVGSVSGE